jgi:hypothetical protein
MSADDPIVLQKSKVGREGHVGQAALVCPVRKVIPSHIGSSKPKKISLASKIGPLFAGPTLPAMTEGKKNQHPGEAHRD